MLGAQPLIELSSAELKFAAQLLDGSGTILWENQGGSDRATMPLPSACTGTSRDDRVISVDVPIRLADRGPATLRLFVEPPNGWQKEDLSVLNETQHRARNLVSLVMAMASQSFAGQVLDPTAAKFMDRLASLDAVVRVGCEADGDLCPVPIIVGQITRRFQDPGFPQFRCEGPNVSLPLRWAHTLALVVHELATNAIRHGALRDRQGHVDVNWQKVSGPSGEASFIFRWREHVSSPPVATTRRGFGSRFLTAVIEQNRRCSGNFSLGPSGATYTLAIRLGESDIVELDGN